MRQRFRGNQRKGAFVNRFRDVIWAGCCWVPGVFAQVAGLVRDTARAAGMLARVLAGAGRGGAARRGRVRGPGLLRST
jgi:hypothetical protein